MIFGFAKREWQYFLLVVCGWIDLGFRDSCGNYVMLLVEVEPLLELLIPEVSTRQRLLG